MNKQLFRILGITLLISTTLHSADPAPNAIRLSVDAREAPRQIIHSTMTLSVRSGRITLLYPKWIPGEHSPSGPIADVSGIRISCGGQAIAWKRDPLDLFTISCDVPSGCREAEVAFDLLLTPGTEGFTEGASATAKLAVLNWNQILMYPKGEDPRALKYAVTLKLPSGWRFASALPLAQESADQIEFSPVSLETLIDSPLIAGLYLRRIVLAPGVTPPHEIDIAADSAQALEMTEEENKSLERLVHETGSLFGARHYDRYVFLFSLSDHLAHFGLEHHESSDNRESERRLIDEDQRIVGATLLPHEFVHSWNGKHRRPAEFLARDLQQPINTELLWVYEGLTTYLASVLAARSGLWTPEQYRQDLAIEAARLDHRAGRSWRPLVDTAVCAQVLYGARSGGEAWRRGVDFYSEGALVWLEADVIIRQKSGGTRSLDDFCRKFYGGLNSPASVRSYTLDDVIRTLNGIALHDWSAFFKSRISAVSTRAPLLGLAEGGWKLTYTETMPEMFEAVEATSELTDLTFSLGLTVASSGQIIDVVPGLPAASAGASPGTELIAVNGRRWTADVLRDAITRAKDQAEPIYMLVLKGEFYESLRIEYRGGNRYPVLERDPEKPDLLEKILSPLAP